jgi:hypothetical protein
MRSRGVKILSLIIIVPILILAIYVSVRIIYDLVARPGESHLEVSLLILGFALFTVVMLLWALIPNIRRTGPPKSWTLAEATVLDVRDTGITIDDHWIRVGMELEVHPPGLPPYKAKANALVPRIEPTRYRPGMVVNVRFNPKKPQKVEIESTKSQTGAGTTMSVGSGAVIYQGKTYSSVDKLPPEARAKYQRAMSALADQDGDGVPDILQGVGASSFVPPVQQSGTVTTNDPAEKLRKLNEMLYDGLITEKEYQDQKAEILSKM